MGKRHQHQRFHGLTARQVKESRKIHGSNLIPVRVSLIDRDTIVALCRRPLLLTLIAAALLSIGVSVWEYSLTGRFQVFYSPIGIVAAWILLIVGTYFSRILIRREFLLLNRVKESGKVTVYRDDNIKEVARKDIVVGDIVLLNRGDEVPADGELLESVSLTFDRPSSVNGKITRGSMVTDGQGVMRVLAVGINTDDAKNFTPETLDLEESTPLSGQLEDLGRKISSVAWIFAGLVVVGRIILYFVEGGFEWLGFIRFLLITVMLAVTLVIVAVPEGLPAAVPGLLACLLRRIHRSGIIIRTQGACEKLGKATVIRVGREVLVDDDAMYVAEMVFYAAEDKRQFIFNDIAVNSTAELKIESDEVEVLGNPEEGALFKWLRNQGEDYVTLRSEAKIIERVPYSSKRGFMATVAEEPGGKRVVYIKGNPENVLAMCADEDSDKLKALEKAVGLQDRGFTVMAFAYKILEDNEKAIDNDNEIISPLNLGALAAIAKPLSPDVAETAELLKKAGIAVEMEGDPHGASAEEISNEGGIVVATAREFFDAPGLRNADVRVSLESGTEAARKESDVTVADNSFTSVCQAVKWGRYFLLTIGRYLNFQLTMYLSAFLLVLFGSFMGTVSPLSVTQMLYVSLILSPLAMVAFSRLPLTDSIMTRAPRKADAFPLDKGGWSAVFGVGGIFFIILAGLVFLFEHTAVSSLAEVFAPLLNVKPDTGVAGDFPGHLTAYEQTLVFNSFVCLQLWNIFNIKASATSKSALDLKGCRDFLIMAAGMLGIQIIIVTFGGSFIDVVPLKLADWIIILVDTSFVLWFGELYRYLTAKSRQVLQN